MEESGILIGFAQLSLVLTGFVAVFVAFFSGEEPPSKPDIHHALSMLIGSVLALLVALVPLIVAAYGLKQEELWFWSSGIGLVLSAAYGTMMLNLTLRLTREEFKRAGVLHMIVSYSLGTTGSILMLLNLFGVSTPGPYILGMILTFMVALVGFITFSVQNFLRL
ncbi:MAG: hypothetical protein NXH85_15870 [Pseudomonadaceae bacterium]|nr:hypothetical protein [Pseudomonadaceae bacterium]